MSVRRLRMKKKSKSPYRAVLTGDIHTGSEVGLATHPKNVTQKKLLALWKHFAREYNSPDLLLVNGDAITGQDPKTMSVKNSDVPHQLEEAVALIKMWNPKEVVLTEGTPYHTGSTITLERTIASQLREAGIKATFCFKLRAKIRGWFKLQARHKIGRSVNPYGVHTAPTRSLSHQVLNAAIEARQSHNEVTWPHLSVFSHVHYWSYEETAQGATMTLPCWQAIGDRYGDTQCDGHVDIGLAQIFINDTEEEGWSWRRYIYPARMESRTIAL